MLYFDHEQLRVYQFSVQFVAWSEELLASLEGKASAKDHLDRAARSIPLNIAESNAKRSLKERRSILEVAIGSGLECAACLDVLMAKARVEGERVETGKRTLHRIVAMLYGLRRSNMDQVAEEAEPYGSAPATFGHEQLKVYQAALRFVSWCERFPAQSKRKTTDFDSLDKASTSIVLNIAEGNGKFAPKDRGRFLDIAIASALRAASGLDVLVAGKRARDEHVAGGKELLKQIVSMLLALRTCVLDRNGG